MARIRFQCTKLGSCNFDVLIMTLMAITNTVEMESAPGAETFWVTSDDQYQADILAAVAAHDKAAADEAWSKAVWDYNYAYIILQAVANDPPDKLKDVPNLLNDEQKNQNRAAYALLVMSVDLFGLTINDFTDQEVGTHLWTKQQKWDFINPAAPSIIPGLTNRQYAKAMINKMVGIHREMEYWRQNV